MNRINISSWLYCAVLVLLFYLALFIRAMVPYKNIFTSSYVRFGGSDSWYHLRLVENTLHHFPHRITFDPFTYYPHGTTVNFPPLFDQLLAFIIWVAGRGNPISTLGEQGIELIAAWYPADLGALTLFPVYFIGKELYNRNVGLFSAALIAILPGQFLSRSLLGFTDHHAAETLFSTVALLFLIFAIKSAKENKLSFYSIKSKDWASLRKPMLYSLVGGIFMGCYFLSWVGAPLFIFLILIYAVVQYVIDHLRRENTEYLGIVTLPVLLVSLAMILPLWHSSAFTEFQVLSLFIGIVAVLVLGGLSFAMNLKKIVPYAYPLVLLALGTISFILLNFLDSSLYASLMAKFEIFVPSESLATIEEASPVTWHELWNGFTTTFFLAFAGLAVVGYNIAKRWRPEEILFLVWCAVMLFACFGQNRFAAYYAVNVAILCGLLSWKVLDLVESRKGGLKKLREMQSRKKVKKKKGGAVGVKQHETGPRAEAQREKVTVELKQYLRTDIIVTFIVILLIVFYPPLNLALAMAKQPCGPDYNQYESLFWMHGNTPDPGVDYYTLYDAPPAG